MAESGSARIGRPRGFDEAAVVTCAMQVFWRVGYAQASVPDISSATGLSTSSIYNTFGSKRGLYLAALDRYLGQIEAYRLGPLRSGSAGVADVGAFLDKLKAVARAKDGRNGCMATKAIAEFGTTDAVVAARTRRYRDALRTALTAAFTRAAERGEIAMEQITRKVNATAGVVIAFNLLVGSGAPLSECVELLDSATPAA